MSLGKSFWGHVVKPGKRYEQVVEQSFHVSKACLELSSDKKGETTTLIIDIDNEEFILSHVSGNKPSDTLDLQFEVGEQICFRSEGPGAIHLSGYLIPDDDYEFGEEADEEEMEDEEEAPALVNANQKKRKSEDSIKESSAKKAKKQQSPKAEEADRKEAVRKATEMKKKIAETAKKVNEEIQFEDSDEDDEEDDDSDEDMEQDEEDEEGEEEDDSDDSDEDGEDSDDEESSEEESPVQKKKKNSLQNGVKALNGSSIKKDKKTPKKEAGDNKKTPKKEDQGKTPKKDGKTPKKQDEKTPNKKDKDGNKTPKKEPGTPGAQTPAKTPKRTLKGGIQVQDLKVGNGPEAKRGKLVGMYYDGRLQTNNKQFDSTLKGDPFKFKLGFGEVIKGWDVGIEGMKVGGKRKLVVPSKMAYGTNGAPPDIPPNSNLVFEVECKFVK